ncbi:MAG: GTPase Era [Chromatiales bacterium]|nr:MAG: GTPase Era [Chromatiales bacterium]
MTEDGFRSGFVAVIGRPNVGKSTLVNALVAEKISIVTPKPQTTRHSILGILSRDDCQIVFVDTPGLHDPGKQLMNRAMVKSASASLVGADLALLVVEARGWQRGDDFAWERLRSSGVPALLVVNKLDRVRPKDKVLVFLEECAQRVDVMAIVPVSARTGDNLERLLDTIREHLPEGPPLFPVDLKTDRGADFRIAEVIREKLLLALHQEVPYGLAVEVRALERRDDLLLADVTIWVDRESHQGMVIGRAGERIKQVGRAARLDLEKVFGQRVHLETRVKVKANWRDSAAALRQLGYEEPR